MSKARISPLGWGKYHPARFLADKGPYKAAKETAYYLNDLADALERAHHDVRQTLAYVEGLILTLEDPGEDDRY